MRRSERELYLSAAKLVDADSQQAFLAESCGNDHELRERVTKLLAARADQDDNLLAVAAPASGVGESDGAGESLPSTRGNDNDAKSAAPEIDRYRIIEELGQGGMGTVYMAEQREPVRRKVALKVIKRGMDSEQVVARFEAERQALALMNHPNIAGVLDAGMTDDGRPFFVMELVRGIPITEYCDRHKLNRDERLKLFKSVCDAVQHAHQKGVIHRDLKPANILVELHDVNHVPKVIDFGVAKATSQRLTDKTLYTLFSQMIGTPLYMSPEQAELSGLDVDTRSDIYSLGVLLYELLTGTTPFDRETFKQASLDEMRRIIREVEPMRPSQRISTLNREQVSTIAEKQSTDVRSLTGRPVKELDWIVVKTLEKDRSRRYESASALASDIDRYLANEPVLACPPSLGYRLSKFASKRKGLLASACLVMLSLIGATTVSLWSAANARQAAEASKKSARLAEQRFQLALESVDMFLSEVTDNEKLKNESLGSLRISLLQSAIPFLEQLVAENSGDTGALVAKAEALLRLGQIQTEIGNQTEALEILDGIPPIIEALTANEDGKDEFRELEAKYYSQSGLIHYALGNSQEAYDRHQNSVLIQKEVVDRSPTVDRQANLAKYLHRTANVANDIDRAEQAMEFIDQAINAWEKVCEQSPDHELYLTQQNSSRITKASVFQFQGDFESAITENEEVIQDLLDLAKRFPENMTIQDNLQVAYANLGRNLALVGKIDKAIERLSRALEMDRVYLEKFPERQDASLGWASTAETLAGCMLSDGQVEESIAQLQEVVDVLAPMATESADRPKIFYQLAGTHAKLADAHEKSGNLDAAKLHFQLELENLDSLVAQFPDLPMYRDALSSALLSTGGLLFRSGEFEAAAQNLTRAIEVMQPLVRLFDTRPGYGKRLATIHGNLSVLMQRLKREQEEEFHGRKRVELLEQLATNHPNDRGLRYDFAIAAAFLGNVPRSLELIEALMHDFPEARTQYLTNQAELLHELGGRSDKILTEQKAFYERAVASLREYLAAFPNEISVQLKLANYLNDLAIVAAKLQDGELLEPTVRESIDAFIAAAEGLSPSNSQVVELCRTSIGDLAELIGNSKTRPHGEFALHQWSEAVAAYLQASPRYPRLLKVLEAAQETTSKSEVTILLEQEKLAFLESDSEANAKWIADTLNSLGMMYLGSGDHESARSKLEESVAVSTEAYGPLHPSTLSHRYDLGRLESSVKNYDAALSIFRSVLDKRTEVLGIEEFDTFKAEEQVFLSLISLERFEEARELMQQRETLQSEAGKQDLRRSAFRLVYIATAETEMKNFDEAIAAYAKSDASYEKLESHAATLDRLLMLNKYGVLLKNLRRHDDAIQVFKDIIAIRERMQEDRPTYLFNRSMLGGAHGNLANVLVKQKEYAKAIEQLEQAEAVFAAILSENPNDRLTQKFQASVLRNMATCYEYSDMPENSIRYFERASAVCVDEQKREINLRYALARIRFAAKGQGDVKFPGTAEVALKYFDTEQEELADEEFFLAANILAISAHSDPALNDEQRQRYQQIAFTALSQAAEMGYFASPSNRDDFRPEEFASLNDDPRFKAFLEKHSLVNPAAARQPE